MLSELDVTLGAVEIGILMSSVLWGVTTVQLYIYMTTPNKDPLWTKLLVSASGFHSFRHSTTMQSLHTIFAWVYLYRLSVTFYGVSTALGETHWSLDISALFDGIIGAIVQMFFAYRIRLFSKSWPVTLASWLGTMLQMAGTLSVTAISPHVSLAEFAARFDWIVEGTLISNLIVDIINTAGLTYYLNLERTGFKRTDIVLQKLVMWAIGECLEAPWIYLLSSG
ncbi:hypothetical protein DFH09DRAFT_913071 [Mycena vulgaris]|nr:hypothetical protein DFH09DRAFT_913071 [Mycena vulgaris]